MLHWTEVIATYGRHDGDVFVLQVAELRTPASVLHQEVNLCSYLFVFYLFI